MVVVAGEITTTAIDRHPDRSCASTVRDIGYTDSAMGFDAQHVRGPHRDREAEPGHLAGRDRGRGPAQGAGRRRSGPHVRLRDATRRRTSCRRRSTTRTSSRVSSPRSARSKKVDLLRPDGKTQVTLEYENDVPVRVDAIVVSTQHDERREVQDAPRGDRRARHREGHARRSSSTRTRSSTSTRPAASSSAARRATAASPAARSSSTPTAAWAVTAAAPSAARTRRRSIARPATTRATSRRTSSPPASRSAARCRSRTRSASRSPVGVHVNTFGTGKVADETLETYILRELRHAPEGAHRRARPPRAAVPPDRGVRSLRPREFSWEKTNRAAEDRRRPPRRQGEGHEALAQRRGQRRRAHERQRLRPTATATDVRRRRQEGRQGQEGKKNGKKDKRGFAEA